jgi:hypothetical protein
MSYSTERETVQILNLKNKGQQPYSHQYAQIWQETRKQQTIPRN